MFIDTVVLLVTCVCLYTDLNRRKIYNLVLLPAVFLAIGYYIYTDGLAGGLFSLQGFTLGLALLFIPYMAGGIGAGDVKLLGTIGALKGTSFIFNTFLAGAIAGGVLAILYMVKNKRLIMTLKKIFSSFFLPMSAAGSDLDGIMEEDAKSITIPYGAAIAIGTLTAYFVR